MLILDRTSCDTGIFAYNIPLWAIGELMMFKMQSNGASELLELRANPKHITLADFVAAVDDATIIAQEHWESVQFCFFGIDAE